MTAPNSDRVREPAPVLARAFLALDAEMTRQGAEAERQITARVAERDRAVADLRDAQEQIAAVQAEDMRFTAEVARFCHGLVMAFEAEHLVALMNRHNDARRAALSSSPVPPTPTDRSFPSDAAVRLALGRTALPAPEPLPTDQETQA